MARASAADKKLLETLRDRYKRATEADHDNRVEALKDIKFVNIPGEQWDPNMKTERGSRPCLESNRLRTTIKRVINSIRSQRPSGKVRPTEDADKKTAEAQEGLIRNIWANSDGDAAVDGATEYVVGGGMGAWRVATKYSRDDAWEQDAAIEQIANPMCLYKDPASRDPFGRDASYWFLTSRISNDAYKAKYPKAEIADFDSETEFDDEDWTDSETTRIVEYWYREPVTETLLLLSDGRSVKESALTPEQMQQLMAAGIEVFKSREVQCYKIKMVIASGNAILERADWGGSMFPFVMVYGEHMVIDGKLRWWGLARHAKDAAKMHNYTLTAAVETVALAPRRFDWATPAQAAGHENNWAEAHKKNFPYKLYNPDPQAPGPPSRGGGAEVPVALLQLSAVAAEEIKAVTGIYDASLGQRSNETSGIAIRQRQEQGEISTFNYSDNIARGVRRTWEILTDLIPHIYDTQRQIRILGVDGSSKFTQINDGVIDLSRGKYDVTVTTGPSFSTQRQEAAEIYTAFAQANPAVFPIAGDLIFKSFDLPYADQIAERLKTLLPPQIQQMEQEGVEMPPEVMQAMQQVDQAMQVVQQQTQLLQEASAEVGGEKAEADKAKSEVQIAIANLKVQEANLRTQEAQFKQLVAETQTKMGEEQGSADLENERESLSAQVQQALAAIQQQAAEFMQQSAQIISEMQNRSQPQVVVANQPTSKQVVVERVNGKLVGTIIEQPMGNA